METVLTSNKIDIFSHLKSLSPDQVTELAKRFKQDGYVVLENCLPKDLFVELLKEFTETMNAKVARTGIKPVQIKDGRNLGNEKVKIDFQPQGGNHDLNRWNMHLPSTPTFLREEIIAHPNVLAILDELIGPDQALFIIASDTPFSNSGYQNIHQDFSRFGLTVNIPLIDFSEENAPIEVWPGSHVRNSDLSTDAAFHTENVSLSAEEIRQLNQKTQSKCLLLKAGSILIRDQRLVHRGTANRSDKPRPCLSLWYKGNAGAFRLQELNIPAPHRFLSNRVAWLALKMREAGRSKKTNVQNKSLVNLGSLLGRLVEEFSISDRDYRRKIPTTIFNSLSPKAQHLLRFASLDGNTVSNKRRSIIGSSILTVVAGCFIFLGLWAYCVGSIKRNKKEKSSELKNFSLKTAK